MLQHAFVLMVMYHEKVPAARHCFCGRRGGRDLRKPVAGTVMQQSCLSMQCLELPKILVARRCRGTTRCCCQDSYQCKVLHPAVGWCDMLQVKESRQGFGSGFVIYARRGRNRRAAIYALIAGPQQALSHTILQGQVCRKTARLPWLNQPYCCSGHCKVGSMRTLNTAWTQRKQESCSPSPSYACTTNILADSN